MSASMKTVIIPKLRRKTKRNDCETSGDLPGVFLSGMMSL